MPEVRNFGIAERSADRLPVQVRSWAVACAYGKAVRKNSMRNDAQGTSHGNGLMAQLVARLLCKQGVTGSSPVRSTNQVVPLILKRRRFERRTQETMSAAHASSGNGTCWREDLSDRPPESEEQGPRGEKPKSPKVGEGGVNGIWRSRERARFGSGRS